MGKLERELTQKEDAAAARDAEAQSKFEQHSVPFFPPVMAFHPGSAIREAFAQWWSPDLRPHKWVAAHRTGSTTALWSLLAGVPRDGIQRVFRMKKAQRVARVMIDIDYPLTKPVERMFQVELTRLGELFGLGFDLYAEVYEADAKLRGGEPAPRIPGMANRQKGELIWGHDFVDLVYEGLLFAPASVEDQANGFLGRIKFVIGS